jgi:hypothetical protein
MQVLVKITLLHFNMSFNLYANNVSFLGIKNVLKFQLHSKCIHKSVSARKMSPQEVYLSNNIIFNIPLTV